MTGVGSAPDNIQEWMTQSVKDRNMTARRGNPLAILGVPGRTVLTNATSIVYDNLAGADEYQIVLDLDQASTANGITARLRLDGTPITSLYDMESDYGAVAVPTSVGPLAQANWALTPATRADKHIEIALFRLNDLARTSYSGRFYIADATANPAGGSLGGRQRDALAYNGIEFNVSTGDVTGISVLRRIVYSG